MEDAHKHYVGKVAQKALIIKGGKFLLVKGEKDLAWDFPGGRLHLGEQPAEGLRREVREEIGIEVRVGKPFFAEMYVGDVDKEPRYFIVFEASMQNSDDALKLETDEVNMVMWVGMSEAASVPMYGVCKNALRAYSE